MGNAKLGVEDWLVIVSADTSMYTGAKTVVRTVYCNSNGFEVKVSMPQGSALSHSIAICDCHLRESSNRYRTHKCRYEIWS